MPTPLRHQILEVIATEIANATKYGAAPGGAAYFQTVRRGHLSQTADKPAALIMRDSWECDLKGTSDAIRDKMMLGIGVFVDNSSLDEVAASLELELAVATLEEVMETNRTIRRMARVIPLGGADGVVQGGWPTADALLLYEVSFERKRGNP